jgi:uncharacterized protein DUF1571
MGRVLVCLPLCLLAAPLYHEPSIPSPDDSPPALVLRASVWHEVLAALSVTPQRSFPDALPWTSVWQTFNRLPDPDPLVFLQQCVARYDREVRGFSLTFRKKERIKGVLNPTEEILVHFRDEPHSVYFQWKSGARLASRALFVEGENDGKLLARAKIGGLILPKPVDGPEAQESGRLQLNQFGLKKALERLLERFTDAQKSKTLHLDYLGVRKIPEVGDRDCYVLHRSKYLQPEDDGVTDVLVYIDTATWLLAGTVSRGRVTDKNGQNHDNQLIAEYYFRDVLLNPAFRAEQFQRVALSK